MKLELCVVEAISGFQCVQMIEVDQYVWELQVKIQEAWNFTCLASEIALYVTKTTAQGETTAKWLHSHDPEYRQLPEPAGKPDHECMPADDGRMPDATRQRMTPQARLDPSSRIGDPAYDLPVYGQGKSREIHLLVHLPVGTMRCYGAWSKRTTFFSALPANEEWWERWMKAYYSAPLVLSQLWEEKTSQRDFATVNAAALKKAW